MSIYVLIEKKEHTDLAVSSFSLQALLYHHASINANKMDPQHSLHLSYAAAAVMAHFNPLFMASLTNGQWHLELDAFCFLTFTFRFASNDSVGVTVGVTQTLFNESELLPQTH